MVRELKFLIWGVPVYVGSLRLKLFALDLTEDCGAS